MQRLFFINRYFFPDHSATSQILSELAFHLAERGRTVHVVTGRQLYDDPNARLPEQELHRGVTIHRVASTRFGRSGLLTRSFDYMSFYWSAWRLLKVFADADDILIPMTDPPLLSILAMRVARRRGPRVINWLQDIYPEVAVALKVPFIKGPMSTLLSSVRNASLRTANANVVVGELMAKKVSQLGVSREHIAVIPNWCDDVTIIPLDRDKNPMRQKWHLQDKFVVGYSGNLGRAHEFATLLDASEHLRNKPHIVFLFVGGGHLTTKLIRNVKERGLADRFLFLPYQGNEFLKQSLSVPDVHWISLKPEVEGLIVPSKFYGVAAAGRPILAVTAENGEIARLVRANQCGIAVAPGNSKGLAEAIVKLSGDAALSAAMGRRARAMLDGKFRRQLAFERWEKVIDGLGQSRTHAADKRQEELLH
jgi:glycosyltransferase involved in cell wall biosynthesis